VTVDFAGRFIDRVRAALDEVSPAAVSAAVETLHATVRAGGRIHVAGNGGSAATAGHLAADLVLAGRVGPRVDAVSLADNLALVTALANDHGYPAVFTGQLEGRLAAIDALVLLSVSGDSENLVRAAALARGVGAVTLGLLGAGGGRLLPLVDHPLVLGSADFHTVEGVHAMLAHLLAGALRERLRAAP
jgi:D-sedoheptulose 7-phosphate isomerase